MFGEIINNKESKFNFYTYLGKLAKDDPTVVRPQNQFNVWKNFCAEITDGTPGKHGAILMYNQLGFLPPFFSERLLDSGRIIHLVRTNVLRTYVSDTINRTTNKPAHERTSDGTLSRIALPTNNLIAELTARQSRIADMREKLASRLTIEVTYEDLVSDTDSKIGEVFKFLRVRKSPVSSSYKRSNPYPLEEMITNYQAVARVLTQSGMEYMLKEPG